MVAEVWGWAQLAQGQRAELAEVLADYKLAHLVAGKIPSENGKGNVWALRTTIIKYLQVLQKKKKTKCPILAYWNGFISAVKLGHRCGRSTIPVGKKSRQKAQKQHRKMLQSFQFLLREESLDSHCEKHKGRRKTNCSYTLQIVEKKTQQ